MVVWMVVDFGGDGVVVCVYLYVVFDVVNLVVSIDVLCVFVVLMIIE